ncbi:ABC transporter ATP-binding protein/permease [Synechococcus sp. CS-1330]|nr:ABC transporter ATP-binding protein/permease [Synechococcus sp. CS-1330]
MPPSSKASKPDKLSLRRDLRRLWSNFSRRRRLQLLALAGLLLASSLAEMVSLGAVVPFLAVLADPQRVWSMGKAQWLAGIFGWQSAGDLVLPLCLGFAAAALLAGGVRLLALWASVRLANAIGSDLSIEVYRRTLYQPYAVHLVRNSSEMISSINQVGAVVTMLNSLLQLATAGLVSFGLAAVLLWLNPAITLAVAAVVAGGYGLAMGLSRKRLQRIGPAIVADSTNVIRSLQEGLGAIRDVILDGSQGIYCRLYEKADRRLRLHQGQGQVLALAPRYGMEAVGLVAIAMAAMVLVAGRTGFLGALPLLGALALGAQRLLPTLQLIYGSWSGLRHNHPALAAVLGYLEQRIDPADLSPAPPPLPFKRELRLEAVSFRYGPDLPWVLRDGQLVIRRGERLGIVGETGSGKSTLVDLLMGLLDPTAGRILVDGLPVLGEELRSWRGAIAHVPQTIFLTDSSIAENIAFGVESGAIDYLRLEQAAQQAQIAGFIASLERGYDTPVGERGVRLSGGQRQRIGIARALYKQAPVLVFDEATSALDQTTETEVMAAIDALSKDLTIVMIAHRLSTLEYCDRLLRVKQGCLQTVEDVR